MARGSKVARAYRGLTSLNGTRAKGRKKTIHRTLKMSFTRSTTPRNEQNEQITNPLRRKTLRKLYLRYYYACHTDDRRCLPDVAGQHRLERPHAAVRHHALHQRIRRMVEEIHGCPSVRFRSAPTTTVPCMDKYLSAVSCLGRYTVTRGSR